MAEAVLDASALLAVLLGEPGAEAVVPYLPRVVVSAVNAAEALTRLTDLGMALDAATRCLAGLDLETAPFATADATVAASLRQATRPLGLSLGDRACLALGLARGLPVLTADREWAKLDAGVRVELIR